MGGDLTQVAEVRLPSCGYLGFWINMEDPDYHTALLYYLSTLGQALAALAALPAIFVQLKINALLRLMVGLGKSMLDRWNTDTAYKEDFVPNLDSGDREFARLRGAVDRHDLVKIDEVMRRFVAIEKKIRTNSPANGFAGMHKHYLALNKQREDLGLLSKVCVLSALAGVLFAQVGIWAIHTGWNGQELFVAMASTSGAVTLIVVGVTAFRGLQDPSSHRI